MPEGIHGAWGPLRENKRSGGRLRRLRCYTMSAGHGFSFGRPHDPIVDGAEGIVPRWASIHTTSAGHKSIFYIRAKAIFN